MSRSTAVIPRVIAVVLAFAGCAGMEIASDYDPEVDFSSFRTYGWMPERESEDAQPRPDAMFIDARVRQAVERELAIKGYRKHTSGTPDFLVGFQTAIEKKLDVYTVDRHYGYGTGPYLGYPGPRGYGYPYRGYGAWGTTVPETRTREYDEGTLILDIVDPESWKPVWRGSAQAEVNLAADPQKKQKRIDEAVRRILERFPPDRTL